MEYTPKRRAPRASVESTEHSAASGLSQTLTPRRAAPRRASSRRVPFFANTMWLPTDDACTYEMPRVHGNSSASSPLSVPPSLSPYPPRRSSFKASTPATEECPWRIGGDKDRRGFSGDGPL